MTDFLPLIKPSSGELPTVKVRFEGTPAEIKDGKQTRAAVPGWPKGHGAVILAGKYGDEQEKITEQTWHVSMQTSEKDPEVQDTKTDFLMSKSAIATAAVMLVRLEGKHFKDPDTGLPLEMSGDLTERVEKARRIHSSVLQFIEREVNLRDRNPFVFLDDEPASD